MQEKPVIVNNTPLVALWSLDQLSLFRELYTEVWIPPAVKAEFLEVKPRIRQASLDNAPWIKTVRLTQPQRRVYAGFHRGEASVLDLAEEQKARLVIIDELKARRYAQQIGLQVTGTIGVLLLAKEQGLINAIQPPITEFQAHGLYLSSALINKALQLAGETQ